MFIRNMVRYKNSPIAQCNRAVEFNGISGIRVYSFDA